MTTEAKGEWKTTLKIVAAFLLVSVIGWPLRGYVENEKLKLAITIPLVMCGAGVLFGSASVFFSFASDAEGKDTKKKILAALLPVALFGGFHYMGSSALSYDMAEHMISTYFASSPYKICGLAALTYAMTRKFDEIKPVGFVFGAVALFFMDIWFPTATYDFTKKVLIGTNGEFLFGYDSFTNPRFDPHSEAFNGRDADRVASKLGFPLIVYLVDVSIVYGVLIWRSSKQD
jgi:hypothetical protein